MGHNPSRRNLKEAVSSTQYEGNQFKARSIWGAWRGLTGDVRARYFNADELAWLNRYGSRLDQLSCLAVESRNEREKHFVGAVLGHHAPQTDRERLWLRAQMVVRYEASLKRAARCGDAERQRDAIAAKCVQLADDLQECEMEAGGAVAAADMRVRSLWSDLPESRKGLCNVAPVLMWRPSLVERSADRPMFPYRECN